MMRIVRGYVLLPHAVPIVVVMTATAAFAVVAAGGWPGSGRMAWLLGAMFGAQIVIGVVNELVDADLDAVAKPNKPIPAGFVSQRGAKILGLCALVLMTACSLRFSLASFALCSLGTATGVAYSVWFKRTVWSWIPYLLALPLLPLWVWATLSSVDVGLFAIYPIGAAGIVAVQIAQSVPDIAADRAAGVRTLAVALGPVNARRACWGATLFAALVAASLSPMLTDHPGRVWLAASIAAALVVLNAVIWRRDARTGALACFPCIATGVVVLGIGWAAALVGT